MKMGSCFFSSSLTRFLGLIGLTLLVGMMTSLPLVSAKVDYNCVFGDFVSTVTPEGQKLEFCHTTMNPPVMSKGDFIWAEKDGVCYECVCEPDVGLACCECPRKRRRG